MAHSRVVHNSWKGYSTPYTGYYPSDGPVTFSYTDIYRDEYDYDNRAKNNLNSISSDLRSDITPTSAAIINLNEMIQRARSAELNFLMTHKFGKYAIDNIGSLITGINRALSMQQVFERNIQIIQEVAQGYTDFYQDMTGYFSSYIQVAVREEVRNLIKAKGILNINPHVDFDKPFMNKVIAKALKKMSSATDYIDKDGHIKTATTKEEKDILTGINAFAKLFDLINILDNEAFVQDIEDLVNLKDFVNKTLNKMKLNKEQLASGEIKRAKALPTVVSTMYGGKKGAIQEIIDTNILPILLSGLENVQGPGFKGMRVGESGGKADVVMYSVTHEIDESMFQRKNTEKVDKSDMSVRAHTIDLYHRLYDNLKDAKGEIIFISDKNYMIDRIKFKSRGGFEAQTATSLKNVGILLDKVKSPLAVDDLINYLANCGPQMMMGEVDRNVLDNLATQIGYFLFDDLDVSFIMPDKVNIIHVFNLSGTYIPLSVVLSLVQKALITAKQNVDNYAKINISYGKTEADKPWTEEAFQDFRQQRIEKTKISTHFMKDFANFINDYIKI